ncbi:nucleotidyltransferase family protein [Vibrio sp. S4M6]|uniref:nucleotidyltransferase family protein n=1 Tax=Vibrio sinus TaxID=2946865 RepID=UPI00202A7781|nr:nucleotidyltransferase family protein [Vibrio sinus]
MTKFCALLLAAGDSTRFGKDKRFIGSPPLLERTLNTLYTSYQRIFLVHKDTDNLSNLNIDPEKVTLLAHNKDTDKSLGASIACGASHLLHSNLSPTFCAIYLADMPFISVSTINRLHQHCLDSNTLTGSSKCIIRPAYQGVQGHPVIFSHHFLSELSQLKACEGAKQVIKNFHNQSQELAVSDEGIAIDIDTPDIAAKLGLMQSDSA